MSDRDRVRAGEPEGDVEGHAVRPAEPEADVEGHRRTSAQQNEEPGSEGDSDDVEGHKVRPS